MNDKVKVLLSRLHLSSDLISQAYFNGGILKSDENVRSIEKLRQLRLLSPGIRDTYQLRGSLRRFLNVTLNQKVAYGVGANLGGFFEQFARLVDEHAIAFQDGRDEDRDQYEAQIQEVISEIADSIEDELLDLRTHVETRFAAVSTIAEKKRQNLYYLKRTQALLSLIESIHFSDFEDQFESHENLLLSFRILLVDRIPAFRESLNSILEVLNNYLFEFRRIEERARKMRAFSLYLKRNPDWTPRGWDEVAEPCEVFRHVTPLDLQAYPDVTDDRLQELLSEIAASIPSTIESKGRIKEVGFIDESDTEEGVKERIPPIRRAIRLFFASCTHEWRSSLSWLRENKEAFPYLRPELWLLRVMSEFENKGRIKGYELRLKQSLDPVFDGNVFVHDIEISRGSKIR